MYDNVRADTHGVKMKADHWCIPSLTAALWRDKSNNTDCFTWALLHLFKGAGWDFPLVVFHLMCLLLAAYERLLINEEKPYCLSGPTAHYRPCLF